MKRKERVWNPSPGNWVNEWYDCWAVSRAHLRLCLCLVAWMQAWSRGELDMTRMEIFPDN